MCKAYSYVRFSSDQQADGDSKRRQSDVSRFCRSHKLTLDRRNYQDLGVSAFTGKNKDEGALGAFLEAVKKGKIKKGSVLIVEQLDRLTRIEPVDAIKLFGDILKSGVRIGHLKKGRILDKSCLRGFAIMEFVMELILANEESAKKSERVTQSLHQNLANAKDKIWTSKGPAWLKLSEDRTHWIVLEDKAATVKLIFEMCIDGLGAEAICKRLVADGIEPLNGKRWNRNYIRNLLRSKIVLGEYQPKTQRQIKYHDDGETEVVRLKERKTVGDPIPDYYTPVIDQTTWYKAQRSLDGRRRHRAPVTRFVNIVGGLVKDKKTDTTMYCATRPGAKKILYPSAAVNGAGVFWSVHLPIVERAVLASVKELEIDSHQSPEENQLEGLRAKRATIKANIDKAQATLQADEDFDAGWTALRNLDKMFKQVENQIEVLEAKLSEKPSDRLEGVKTAIQALEESNTHETRLALRSQLRSLIERIVITKENAFWSGNDGVSMLISYVDQPVARRVCVDLKENTYVNLRWDKEEGDDAVSVEGLNYHPLP